LAFAKARSEQERRLGADKKALQRRKEQLEINAEKNGKVWQIETKLQVKGGKKMPTFLQQTFRKRKHVGKRTIKKAKRKGYKLGKESEAIVRTTGAIMATGAAVGTMGLIGKLGKD
jgi:hypothetical protein